MRLVLFTLLLFIQQALYSSNQPGIIPEPAHIQFETGNFTVNNTTRITVNESAILPIATLFTERVQSGTGIEIKTVHKNISGTYTDKLTKEHHHFIIGVQGNVWTEYMKTPERVAEQTFPRAFALSEVAWSASTR